MNWLDKLEKKFPKFGIPNITLILVAGNVIGYIIGLLSSTVLNYCSFDAYSILHGQIWRLVTWILIPTQSLSNTMGFLLTILFLWCAASWGRSLEHMLGEFRMTVFVLGGVLISDIGGFLFYLITFLIPGITHGAGASPVLTTYYIILSILMEIAILFPEGVVNLWFILPIKMKWMLYITLAELAYEIYNNFASMLSSSTLAKIQASLPFTVDKSVLIQFGVLYGFMYSASIIFALINLLVFYLLSRNHLTGRSRKRQKEFRQEYRQATPRVGSGITKHKCAICGRTEVSNPELTFRYCSKCPSGLEYCNDHLFTHEHR